MGGVQRDAAVLSRFKEELKLAKLAKFAYNGPVGLTEEKVMAELTIGEARNQFSALIAELINGEAEEHIIKKRDVPVARIVPYEKPKSKNRVFGLCKDDPIVLDYDVFDALDEEIIEDFGM